MTSPASIEREANRPCAIPSRESNHNARDLGRSDPEAEFMKLERCNCDVRRHARNNSIIGSVAVKKICPDKVLLLQGPVGPFFRDLNAALFADGYDVRQVIFNAGDYFFAPKSGCIRFTGSRQEWEKWLRLELTKSTPVAIVLFGSSRPVHEIARRVAACFDVAVLSLEEGYLRSGYVSCELGGNNQHSPLSNWVARAPHGTAPNQTRAKLDLRFPFLTMAIWASAYFLARDLLSRPSDEELFHRDKERIIPLVAGWATHMAGRFVARLSELRIRASLRHSPGFLLVPLQVGSDSQLRLASLGWTTPKLIDACVEALSRSGRELKLVFKLHPLERGSAKIRRLIRSKTAQYGVDRHRVCVLKSGRMGDLAAHASGMVVINSTSAFSALHHNTPVLVLGEAVFRHNEIVTLGKNKDDIAAFFKLRQSKSRRMIDAFFSDLKAASLLAGDFYVAAGRKVAIEGILKRLKALESLTPSSKEANG